MKTTTKNELSCSVFGHNLERLSKDSHELTCKTCNSKIAIDNNGTFEMLPLKNENIKTALRQLFFLQKKYSPSVLSA